MARTDSDLQRTAVALERRGELSEAEARAQKVVEAGVQEVAKAVVTRAEAAGITLQDSQEQALDEAGVAEVLCVN